MSRRDLIRMTPDEVREFLEGRHTLNVATHNHDGTVHLVAMWYGFLDGDIAFETFAKSQKVQNLRRDPRITVLVEDGDQYENLRGVEMVGRAEIVEDHETIMEVARGVLRRYHDIPAEDLDGAAEFMVRKRVGVRVNVDKVVSWDHRKLSGGY
ncbi:MAG: TIGR03618 family F420-dependent PPOX class oxidoreductase [Microthrixaceae bacterium]|jgi:PPOX class probable F420-dependent enzyme|nr:TIGR03618 family F420-dependent PPOX class oxidoreductase [Microthrixaceae bacterium]